MHCLLKRLLWWHTCLTAKISFISENSLITFTCIDHYCCKIRNDWFMLIPFEIITFFHLHHHHIHILPVSETLFFPQFWIDLNESWQEDGPWDPYLLKNDPKSYHGTNPDSTIKVLVNYI